MAATRLIAMHINKGHTVAECLKARTDYAANPEKTEGGELVTSYECDPATCDEEFLLTKREYEHKTGRK
ncbi:MAG: relaxase, partial [Lachnospiraceae bacterium]|nr:relaxase [Lachnospiraceae bacterium]